MKKLSVLFLFASLALFSCKKDPVVNTTEVISKMEFKLDGKLLQTQGINVVQFNRHSLNSLNDSFYLGGSTLNNHSISFYIRVNKLKVGDYLLSGTKRVISGGGLKVYPDVNISAPNINNWTTYVNPAGEIKASIVLHITSIVNGLVSGTFEGDVIYNDIVGSNVPITEGKIIDARLSE